MITEERETDNILGARSKSKSMWHRHLKLQEDAGQEMVDSPGVNVPHGHSAWGEGCAGTFLEGTELPP